MIMNGLQGWNDNPVLISVDSLENPLKDIEFPAITICPDFKPDHTALKELIFNLFEYNCDVGNDDCDQIRQDFNESIRNMFDSLWSTVDKAEFKDGYFDIDYSNCTTKNEDDLGIPCIFPFELNGTEHYECIWENHPLNENWPWCPTTVNGTVNNYSELTDWGNCDLGCPIQPKPEGMS